MPDNANLIKATAKRVPWNKRKLIGPRPPLRQKHVWAVRTWLQMEQQTRDLALFNLAIDSKLRGCDVVAVRVDHVAPNVGRDIDRTRQQFVSDSLKVFSGIAGLVRCTNFEHESSSAEISGTARRLHLPG